LHTCSGVAAWALEEVQTKVASSKVRQKARASKIRQLFWQTELSETDDHFCPFEKIMV